MTFLLLKLSVFHGTLNLRWIFLVFGGGPNFYIRMCLHVKLNFLCHNFPVQAQDRCSLSLVGWAFLNCHCLNTLMRINWMRTCTERFMILHKHAIYEVRHMKRIWILANLVETKPQKLSPNDTGTYLKKLCNASHSTESNTIGSVCDKA